MSEHKIIDFKPLAEVEVDRNIEAFVNYCKYELDLWRGDNFDWDGMRWDIGGYMPARGRKKCAAIVWSNFESTGERRTNSKVKMKEPFCSFAKGYVRYTQSKSINFTYTTVVTMLKCLEYIIFKRKNCSNIKYVSCEVLDETVDLMIKNFKNASNLVLYLKTLYDFLREKKLCQTTLVWIPPKISAKPPKSIDEQAIKESKEKCPTSNCMYGIAKIFVESKDPVDIMGSSIAVIMLAQPCRIGEVLTLAYDCEVHDFHGQGSYSLRWFPEKGGDPTIKQVPDDWVDIVKQAVLNIKNITSEARLIAEWYENHDHGIYLPPHLSQFRDVEYLTFSQAAILFSLTRNSLKEHMQNNEKINTYKNDPIITGIEADPSIRRVLYKKDLDNNIRSMLPSNFPYCFNDLKYSQSLFIVPNKFCNRNKFCFSQIMFEPVDYNKVITLFGMSGGVSIFDNNSVYEPDGKRIKFCTHSARHWQNNLMHRNHVPELWIAMTSGRKNIKQNTAYYHTTDEERFEDFQKAVNKTVSRDVDTKVYDISDNDALTVIRNQLREVVGTAIVTDTGFCIHDISTQPCRKNGNHIACADHLYLKNDPRNKHIYTLRDNLRALLQEREEKYPDVYNVSVWRTSKLQQLAILNNIIQILEDSEIPNGVFFRLSLDNEFNPVKISLYNKLGRQFLVTSQKVKLIQTIDLKKRDMYVKTSD